MNHSSWTIQNNPLLNRSNVRFFFFSVSVKIEWIMCNKYSFIYYIIRTSRVRVLSGIFCFCLISHIGREVMWHCVDYIYLLRRKKKISHVDILKKLYLKLVYLKLTSRTSYYKTQI